MNKKKELKREQTPDARPEERLIEDGGMKERRDGEREGWSPPGVSQTGVKKRVCCSHLSS